MPMMMRRSRGRSIWVCGRGYVSHVDHENSTHSHSSGGDHGFKSHSFALHRMSGEESQVVAALAVEMEMKMVTSSTSRKSAASKYKYDALSYMLKISMMDAGKTKRALFLFLRDLPLPILLQRFALSLTSNYLELGRADAGAGYCGGIWKTAALQQPSDD
eukprot:Gb_19678 [translate_table: standard]